ncbi:barstar family protein [Saccharothrix variisporea]|uniref:Barstar (Barnase inhibitor) n=1 Tax=Saccharothrix variisporea TaxID=543527 RepID=A0A495X1T3_9PSEU|nr:barstar family protein [Saccharothrix variisporea]RKT67154.1 barstar (barnase inhibitor) [Saccharothrix variisporea]
MTINSGDGLPEERQLARRDPVGPRWLLCGGVGFEDSQDEVPLALFVDVEGLFVDLPPRPRERFTLVGCSPVGVLGRLPADALGTERAWLGNISLTAPGTSSSWWGEELGDVVVVAQRPSASVPGTVDIDLDGFVRVHDRTDGVVRPRGVDGFVLLDGNEVPCGTCQDVTGVFREESAPPVPQVRLIGCRPEPSLQTALDAVGQSTNAGLRRRRVHGWVHTVADDGAAVQVIGAVVAGTVSDARPSRLGAGLVDVTVDVEPGEPLPAGMLDVLEQWRAGRPTTRNLWAGYDRELRHRWAGVALAVRSAASDRPAGTTFDLDGRFVTDVEGFYCALGEAVNGPGGYFGWNLDALDDCLRGGFGARTPFRLVWHDSAVARQHLVAGYDQRRMAPAVTLDYLLGMFAEHGVEIDLR